MKLPKYSVFSIQYSVFSDSFGHCVLHWMLVSEY